MTQDYTVKEHINKATGEIHRTYLYNRKPCHRILLDTPTARQLAGYVLIEKDLRSATYWISEIENMYAGKAERGNSYFGREKDPNKHNMTKGFFVAALTFYGKAFAQARGRRVKLERLQLDSRFYELHDVCIEYRNNFAAHSGTGSIERVEIAVVLPINQKRVVMPKIFSEMDQPDISIPVAGQIQVSELFEHARLLAARKINQLSNKIYKEEILPKTREELMGLRRRK